MIILVPSIDLIAKELRESGLKIKLMGFSPTQIATITASPFYHENFVRTKGGKKVTTIATRSLLAVHASLPRSITQELLNISSNKENFREFSKIYPRVRNMKTSFLGTNISNNNVRFSQFPLPRHPLVFELEFGTNAHWPFLVCGIPIAILLYLIIYFRRNDEYKNWIGRGEYLGVSFRNIFLNTWGYVVLLCIVLLYLIMAGYLLKYVEIQAFLNNEVSKASEFVHMEFDELCTWVIVFTVTGYEDEIFPITTLGKIIASSIRITTIGCAMFILGRISADYVKNLIKGKKMEKGYHLQEHIVICNWSEKAERIVEELHSSLLRESGMARPIIVITDAEVKFPDTPEFEDTFCIPGDPASSWKLRNANVHDAFSIIILVDPRDKKNNDTHTIMIAMEMADIIDEMIKNKQIKKRPHIAAEIINGKNAKYLARAGVDEIISGNDIGVKLLAQTSVTPGITAFMDDLLHYSSDSNEIYIVDPPQELLECQANFSEISGYLLANRNQYHQAILVGVQITKNNQVLVNPDKEAFPGLKPGDKLVVMARSRPDF